MCISVAALTTPKNIEGNEVLMRPSFYHMALFKPTHLPCNSALHTYLFVRWNQNDLRPLNVSVEVTIDRIWSNTCGKYCEKTGKNTMWKKIKIIANMSAILANFNF